VRAVGACAIGLLLAGCSGLAAPPTPTPRPSPLDTRPLVQTPAPGVTLGSPAAGQRLLIEKGCGGCHTVTGIPGASGVAGPNLTNVGLRPTLAGDSVPNSPDTMVAWLMDPAAVKPGARMPRTGLTQQEARDLTAFLFSQPYNPPS
jgi:cytochrome c1